MLSGFAVVAGLSVTGSVMILIVLAAKRVLKKRHEVSRRAFVFLWLLIFLRMCLPFGVDVIQPEKAVLPGQTVYHALSQQAEEVPAARFAENPDAVLSAGEVVSAETVDQTIPGETSAAADRSLARMEWIRNALPLAVKAAEAVWLAGALGLAGFFLLAYLRRTREVQRMPDRGVPLVARTAMLNAKQQTGISRRRVRIKIREGTGGAVCGILRPTVLLGRDSVGEAEMVLTHECVHIRQWDNLSKVFAFAVLALHWFNPLMWVAVRSFCRDVEMSCDEGVLKAIREDSRKHYAVAILSSSQVRPGRPGLSYFGESPVSERVKHVLGIRRKQFAAPVAAVLTAAFLLLGCFTSPVAEAIAEYGGSLDSGFLDFTAVSEQEGEILDYTACEGGSLFVIREDESGRVKILAADENGDRRVLKELPAEEGSFLGEVYYNEGNLYYALLREDVISLQRLELESLQTNEMVRIGNTGASMRLFGGDHYLCWYEEHLLRVMDLDSGRIEYSFRTCGEQDYGAMAEGYLAYSYETEGGDATKIRCLSPGSGDAFEVESLLGQNTCSAYGNSRFLVYKEEYKLGSECCIYDRERGTTVKLMDFVDPAYAAELNAKKWGITLVGNRLLVFGEGSAVYEVNLETGETVKTESAKSGVGFYQVKNAGGEVSVMLFTVQARGLSGSGNLYVGKYRR